MRLLLASKSETRRRMLEAAKVPFEIVEAPFDEEGAKASLGGLSGSELAHQLAERKAISVRAGPGDLILGSDQVLERDDDKLLSKATSREELADQLRSLRGKRHRLISAAVIVEESKPVWSATESATLDMRGFSDAFLSDYLDAAYDEVRWSVGGYLVEGLGLQLFERIEGSHFAVLGMPLLPLLDLLRIRGVLQD